MGAAGFRVRIFLRGLGLRAGLLLGCGFQGFLRPSVIGVPVRGSGWWVCLSAAGFRVHNPAAPQASSTPASESKSKGPDQEQDQEPRARARSTAQARSRAVVKSRASGGPRQPQGNLRGSLGWLGESQRLRFVGWCGPFPSVASSARGVQHRCPGVKSARGGRAFDLRFCSART